ncbi:hypothetical protein ACCO45_005394 [Purpureocillium lilacinum]|uniref:Uncharacterized protein n=1 Tax=Purpureocillium lilacinum TaxID=33203 RepID=A0ACC4DVC8_PURLI
MLSASLMPGTLQMWAQWLAQMPDIDIQDRVLSVTAQLPGPKGNANAQGTCATTGTKYVWSLRYQYTPPQPARHFPQPRASPGRNTQRQTESKEACSSSNSQSTK